ncbi:MAG: prolyl oligopeptidase family serine peptidase, partial [Thermoanaerobaculia bacterium]
MKRLVYLALTPIVVLAAAAAAAADPRPAAESVAGVRQVTLELIMSDPDWIGNRPQRAYWSDDGQWVYYEQKRQGEERFDLLRIAATGGDPAVVQPQQRGTVDVAQGELSRDRRLKTYALAGDVFVKDLVSGEIRQLTRTAATESRPFFMATGHVAFHRGDEVFVRDLDSGLEVQPADLRLDEDPADEKDADGYLARQQPRLFDVIREQQEEREHDRDRDRAEQQADPTRPPLPWYLGKKLELLQTSLSPGGDRLLVVTIPEKRDDGKKDRMARHVTDSGYVKAPRVRSKVGTGDGTGERLLLLDLATREKHELDLTVLPGILEDPLAELRLAAAAREDGEEASGEAGGEAETPASGEDAGEDGDDEAEPRAVRFAPVAWSFDGEYAAVMARSVDNKDRWIAVLGRGDSELRPVHRVTDEAWINWRHNEFGWLADGRSLYYLSEETGSSQLFLHSVEDGSTRRLSRGGAVVSDPRPGRDGRFITFTANPDHPGIYETYRVEVASGDVEQLTDLGGKNESLASPDGSRLLITHSTTAHPPELYVQEARPGATPRRLTDTVSRAFTALPWIAPEVVAVPSSHHDLPVYARFYAPPGYLQDAAEPRPAVVFVHGAGYLQNAHQGWSGYFREFMFHTFLARHGYLVLDMDYRASAGYGAAWRTAIYRQMGTPELEDLEDGVAWLVGSRGADRRRVGVYGGSYGGFLTLMALFKEPQLFAAGAALRPVTDWAHYNHGYTSNILNTPDVDPEAYERSSPIEHAAGLAKPLLLCAPMLDDNVFFQDTVRLAQRLIELGKED